MTLFWISPTCWGRELCTYFGSCSACSQTFRAQAGLIFQKNETDRKPCRKPFSLTTSSWQTDCQLTSDRFPYAHEQNHNLDVKYWNFAAKQFSCSVITQPCTLWKDYCLICPLFRTQDASRIPFPHSWAEEGAQWHCSKDRRPWQGNPCCRWVHW